MINLIKQQEMQINYLLDRIQGVEPIVNKRLHDPVAPEPKNRFKEINTPIIDGLTVEEVEG